MGCYRGRLKKTGLSDKTADLISRARASSTIKSYEAKWKLWSKFCESRNFDPNPSQPDISHIAEFLTDQVSQGRSYAHLNVCSAALSMFLPPYMGQTIGCHQIIRDILRATYKSNPPRARYVVTWDVGQVVSVWDCENENLNLLDLSIKTFTRLPF